MNITIRRGTPDDAADYQRIYSQPQVYTNTLQLPYPSLEFWRQKLADYDSEGKIPLVAEVDGVVVGDITLFTSPRPRIRHVVSFGMAVDPHYGGQGIGSCLLSSAIDYAFNWLNATRIELGVFSDNQPALKLYRKFGFEQEGIQRQAALRDGQYCDIILMARLR
ncbi:acetyltransferase [Salmonella enterica subsp. enterica serovar Choleraesuis]|nr:acetyltransferase [Salmonella enterica subsp. enterica serovar Choleraesuis]